MSQKKARRSHSPILSFFSRFALLFARHSVAFFVTFVSFCFHQLPQTAAPSLTLRPYDLWVFRPNAKPARAVGAYLLYLTGAEICHFLAIRRRQSALAGTILIEQ